MTSTYQLLEIIMLEKDQLKQICTASVQSTLDSNIEGHPTGSFQLLPTQGGDQIQQYPCGYARSGELEEGRLRKEYK